MNTFFQELEKISKNKSLKSLSRIVRRYADTAQFANPAEKDKLIRQMLSSGVYKVGNWSRTPKKGNFFNLRRPWISGNIMTKHIPLKEVRKMRGKFFVDPVAQHIPMKSDSLATVFKGKIGKAKVKVGEVPIKKSSLPQHLVGDGFLGREDVRQVQSYLRRGGRRDGYRRLVGNKKMKRQIDIWRKAS